MVFYYSDMNTPAYPIALSPKMTKKQIKEAVKIAYDYSVKVGNTEEWTRVLKATSKTPWIYSYEGEPKVFNGIGAVQCGRP
jgi:hypothetical protein